MKLMDAIAEELAAELDRLQDHAPGPAARIRALLAHLLDQGPAQPDGTVRMLISADTLRHILKLPASTAIIGARASLSARAIELHIAAPEAPDGTTEMEPVYRRQAGQDVLVAIRWRHGENGWTTQNLEPNRTQASP